MERSSLPLLTWFTAIACLAANPDIPAAELGEKLQIRRSCTVRKMIRKIREALSRSGAAELLAGWGARQGDRRAA